MMVQHSRLLTPPPSYWDATNEANDNIQTQDFTRLAIQHMFCEANFVAVTYFQRSIHACHIVVRITRDRFLFVFENQQ